MTLLSIVLLSTFAIRGEAPVSTPILTNAPAEQSSGIIASNGSTFFAAWHDDREERTTFYAARLSSAGELLDPTNIRIPISPSVFNVALVQILPLHDDYAVLWTQQVSAPDGGITNTQLSAMRFDRDGHALSGPQVLLDNASVSMRGAATNGTTIVVAYEHRYALFDEKFNVIARDLELPNTNATTYAGAVASNGSTFAISYLSMAGTNVAIVDAAGRILSKQYLGVAYVPGLASDGTDYLIAYRNSSGGQFFAQRITAETGVAGLPQPIPQAAGIATGADLTWIGGAYLIASSMTQAPAQQVFGTRLDRSGNPIDSQPFPLSDPSLGNRTLSPSIAWIGSRVAVLWHRGEAPNIDTYATVVDSVSLQRSNAIQMSRSAVPQYQPALAFNGRTYLAVWSEPAGLFAGRLTLDGQQLDGRSIQLSPTGGAVRATFDGENYLVAFTTPSGSLWTLSTIRIRPDTGEVLEPVQITNAPCAFSFDIAASLVAWDDCGKSIRVTRIDRDGRPTDLPKSITPDSMKTVFPSIAWNGSEYLIAFQEQILSGYSLSLFPYYSGNIRAVRLTPELTVLDTEPLAIATSETIDEAGPRASSNGKDFLVGWTRDRTDVSMRRVAIDGTLDARASIANGALWNLVWDGLRYAAAYTANGDALMTHVGANDRWSISATADNEDFPQLVVTGPGSVSSVYRRIAVEQLYGGVSRVFVRDPSRMRGRVARTTIAEP